MTGGFGAGDAKFAAAMAPFVALGDLRLIAQGADVIPLAHSHRPAGFFDGHLDVELAEGFNKNLRRRE